MPSVSTEIYLDKLPIKLIHKILNYLSSSDIFISLHNINTWMNTILNTYDRYQLNFQSISMSHFYITLHHINPYQVISLTLSNMDDTPGQFELFLSVFSIKQFRRLQSFQLLQPSNPIDLNRILTDLHTLDCLQTLSILHCHPSSVNQETFLLFSSFINTSTSLRRLYLSGILNTIFEYNFTSSINHLYYNDNLFNTVTLQNIVSRMPDLQSLDTSITLNINSMHLSSFIHLTRFIITIYINMKTSDLETLLNQMPLLVFLKIIANGKQWFNGHFWEQCLPSKLQTFQFNFSTRSTHINEETILETFQTLFWLDKKHWYVMLDYQMNPSMTHLYSLPYCDTQFYYRPSIDSTRRLCSSVPNDKLCMHNVTKLTMDLSTLTTESNPPISSTHFFANISTLILADIECCLSGPPLFKFLESVIDFSHIVELKLGQYHHPDFIRILYNRMPRLNSLRIAESMYTKLEMLDFRNIRDLIICDSPTNVDKMCLIFPYIKYLCVRLTTFEHMRQVIKSLEKTLTNVTFRHINQVLQEQIVKWLVEYCGDEHRRFSYDTDEHMNLHIWLDDFLI